MNEAILNIFPRIDPKKIVVVSAVKEEEYYVDFHFKNALYSRDLLPMLKPYLPNVHFALFANPANNEELVLRVSKLNQPTESYSAYPYIQKILNSKDNRIFMGLDKFGESYLDVDSVVHLGIFGKTGYGKSSFVKYLLSQFLAFRDDVQNILFDVKGTEFTSFKDHPRVISYIRSQADATHMMNFLAIELAKREFYFSQSFKVPPTKLTEYRDEKQKYKRSDLPDFKRIFIWIDEASTALRLLGYEAFHNGNMTDEAFRSLINRCRAVGITFVISSQSLEGMRSIQAALSHTINFHNSNHPMENKVFEVITEVDSTEMRGLLNGSGQYVDLPVPGRIVFSSIEEGLKSIQVPFCSSPEARHFAFKLKKISSKRDFFKHSYDTSLLEQVNIPKLILIKNFTYTQFVNYDFFDDVYPFKGNANNSQSLKLNVQNITGFIGSVNPFSHLIEDVPLVCEEPVEASPEVALDKKEAIAINDEELFSDFLKILDQPTKTEAKKTA